MSNTRRQPHTLIVSDERYASPNGKQLHEEIDTHTRQRRRRRSARQLVAYVLHHVTTTEDA